MGADKSQRQAFIDSATTWTRNAISLCFPTPDGSFQAHKSAALWGFSLVNLFCFIKNIILFFFQFWTPDYIAR